MSKHITLARAVLENESDAIRALIDRLDDNFSKACEIILACEGRTIITGMGKSGHIGNKIAATLASTGTPSFFLHPGEASHGDLGMIKKGDVIIALSNSGETNEIVTLIPLIKRQQIPLISLTGNPASSLSKSADINIDVSIEKEACPLGLAPTTSTTTALAMGDALAIALLESRGFTADDFALAHPGGSLGRRLLLHVADIMHSGTSTPVVQLNTSLSDTLIEITEKGLGATAIVDDNKIVGFFTDGDVRRIVSRKLDFTTTTVAEVMTQSFKTIQADCLAAEALQIMDSHKINALPVVDNDQNLLGILNMHDLLRAGVI